MAERVDQTETTEPTDTGVERLPDGGREAPPGRVSPRGREAAPVPVEAPSGNGAPGGNGVPVAPDATSAPLPYLPVAGVLLVFVLVVLVGGYLLDRRFRPRPSVELPPAVATAEAQATSSARPTTAPTVVPSATPVPPPQPTAWPSVARTPLEREVETAYQRYWEVTTQAWFTLDTSKLMEVLAGEELPREEKRIRDLAAEGYALQLVYQHRISFPEVSDGRAILTDELINDSRLLDAATKEPQPDAAASEAQRVRVEMQRLDGRWKVVEVAVYR